MYRTTMRYVAALVFLTLTATPALAGATAWQELTPGAQVRLISTGEADGNGTLLAGIELQLPPSANTYWRIPGDSGIPTSIDLSASRSVNDAELIWPYPRVEETGGYRDFVYRHNVVLPIRFKAEPGAVLDAVIVLGVCSDICVPARAHLSLPLDLGKPDEAQSIRLDQALADAPAAWDQPGEPFGAVSVGTDHSSLKVAAPNPAIDPETVIADVGDSAVIFAAPQKSPDGAIWSLRLVGGENLAGLAGRSLRLTFMTARGAYFTDRTIGPAQQ
jgi:DsbC/DsbD-like thiol-disulfide interchange protein